MAQCFGSRSDAQYHHDRQSKAKQSSVTAAGCYIPIAIN